jgi:hypothetical protein
MLYQLWVIIHTKHYVIKTEPVNVSSFFIARPMSCRNMKNLFIIKVVLDCTRKNRHIVKVYAASLVLSNWSGVI